MKTIAVVLSVLAAILYSQTTIAFNPDLYAIGVIYTNRTIDDASFEPGPPGSGLWDFTSFVSGEENTFYSVVYSPSIPHIGDCIITPNYIVYDTSSTDSSETEGWIFCYADADSGFLGLGLYGTYTTTTTSEFWGHNDPYDASIEYPVNYLDSWMEITESEGGGTYLIFTIDYEGWDSVYHTVDGYGSIVLPNGTFDALRVRRFRIKYTHSDFLGIDKTTRQYSYAWLVTELGTAVTFEGPQDSTGGIPDSIFSVGKLVIQTYNSALGIEDVGISSDAIEVLSFPNPFNSSCQIRISISDDDNRQPNKKTEVTIYDLRGNIITASSCGYPSIGETHRITPANGTFIWTPDESTPSGIYLAQVKMEDGYKTAKRVVYLK